MNLKLKNKVAVVTGSSKGIGAGIAKQFALAGAKVVINYANDEAGAAQVVDEIRTQGGTAIAVQADVKLSADVKNMFETAREAFGSLDILVNNAGVYKIEPLESVSEESFHAQVNTHLFGTFLCSQQALKHFGEEGGSIINISSTVSQNPVPGTAVYAAAKAGVDAMTKALAKELGPRKIRVNTLAPGMTETEGTRDVIRGSELEKQMLSITPLGRIGLPEDMAKVALFLASDDAAWVTGERITVSGGLL